jgi:DNA-binding GntR family transcriptional regulator
MLLSRSLEVKSRGARSMKTHASLPEGLQSSLPTDPSPEPLKHRAYGALKSRIVSGVLSPGALLSERQLAQSLKMSKTPVHAALERLEAEGLVTVTAQQGFVVRSITPEEIADHFELREALEIFVVARLAGKLTPAQTSHLKRNLADHRRALRLGDVAEHIRIDSEFHLLLCECYGNKEITRAMGQIRDKLHRVMHHISTRFPERMSGALAEHEAIAASLVSGDGKAASERMSIHLQNGLRSVYHRHR